MEERTLEESFVLKEENITNTHQEIVYVGIEDIKREDPDVPEENVKLEDHYNTETYFLPDEVTVINRGSQQIEIKGENDELERNSETNCEVMVFKEEPDFIDVPIKYETNPGINDSDMSLSNQTMGFCKTEIGERNWEEFKEYSSENLLFSLLNTKQTEGVTAQETESETDKSEIKIKGECTSGIEETSCKTTISNDRTKMFRLNSVPQNLKEILEKRATMITKGVADCEFEKMGNNEHRCNHCQVVVVGEKEIARHVRLNHRMKPKYVKARKKRKCPYCNEEVVDLNSHKIYKHSEEKDIKYFKCDLCDYKAKMKRNLTTHLLYKHTKREDMMDKLQKCQHCSLTFKTRGSLIRHQKRIHIKTKYQCTHCDFTTFLQVDLVDHVKEHICPEALETHNCPHCEFTTLSGGKYRKHLATHSEKNLQCHMCSYQADLPYHFNLHMMSHKKVKDEKDCKYKCDKCDYKTYRHNNLRMHKLNHLKPEEIQYFYCYHCKFKAKRKDKLKEHIRRHFEHSEIPLQCSLCDFTTKNRGKLISHIPEHSRKVQEWL